MLNLFCRCGDESAFGWWNFWEFVMAASRVRPFLGSGFLVVLGFLALPVSASVGGAQDLYPPAPQRNSFPAVACSRPASEEAARIEQLVRLVEQTRVKAAHNPLLLADAAYYEAELAATRRCIQSLAAR